MGEDLLKNAYDAATFRTEGHKLVDLLADYLEEAVHGQFEKVIEWAPPKDAAAHWAAFEGGPGDIFREVLRGAIKLHHPRYMGHQVSPPLPAAALAGLLNDLLNNGMGVYEMGIPGTAMERFVVRSVADKMGFGPASDGILTSGGTLANLTAILCARSIKAGQPVWKSGNKGQLALMVSAEAHYCVDRAVRIMGWGADGIIKVPVDDRFRMRTEFLEPLYQEALAAGKEVIAVVGSACTTASGSFDDLRAIGRFAKERGLWFHVDGAHGLACAYAQKYRFLTEGVELADSLVMDFHKMLLSPTITTALVFRSGEHSFRTFAQKAEYLLNQEGSEDWYNLAKRTFETTKTMLSLRPYLMMKQYGESLFETYITRVNDLCAAFAAMLEGREGWELATQPFCNILCFRFVPPGADEQAANTFNATARQALIEAGEFYLVQTVLRGKTWLRVTLTNPFTAMDDLRALVEAVEQFHKPLRPGR
jgi:L-2,4-diaminobutyrate decarboxylase